MLSESDRVCIFSSENLIGYLKVLFVCINFEIKVMHGIVEEVESLYTIS